MGIILTESVGATKLKGRDGRQKIAPKAGGYEITKSGPDPAGVAVSQTQVFRTPLPTPEKILHPNIDQRGTLAVHLKPPYFHNSVSMV